MLTHGNLGYEARGAAPRCRSCARDDAVMLFLPLAHSFAQDVKAAWVGLGFRMIFAQSTDTLMADLVETSPTILPAVPRIFEKVYNGVVTNGSSAPGVKGKLFRWAMRLFEESVEARIQGRSARLALLRPRQAAGLQQGEGHAGPEAGRQDAALRLRRRAAAHGRSPTSSTCSGFEVLEGYGLTETTGGATVNPPGKARHRHGGAARCPAAR